MRPSGGRSSGPRATASAIRNCSGRNWSATIRAAPLPRQPAWAMPRSRPHTNTSPLAVTRAPGFTSPSTSTAPSTSRCSPARRVPRCTCRGRLPGGSGLGAPGVSACTGQARAVAATRVLGFWLISFCNCRFLCWKSRSRAARSRWVRGQSRLHSSRGPGGPSAPRPWRAISRGEWSALMQAPRSSRWGQPLAGAASKRATMGAAQHRPS